MSKTTRSALVLIGGIALAAVLFFAMRREAEARWFFRNETAVNTVAVCTDGVYIGVAAQNNITSVTVTARIHPTGTVVFNQTFSLPAAPIPEQFITHHGFFYQNWDPAYTPLPVGTTVNFGSQFSDVLATVGGCVINPSGSPLNTAFTYQGQLSDNGNPAGGSYDFRFRLFDTNGSGMQVGSTVTRGNVNVVEGLFTLSLDFGANAFTGGRRWLEIAVRPGSSTGGYTALSPRQELTATPYALGLRAGATISGSLEGKGVLTLSNNVGDTLHILHGQDGIQVDFVSDVGLQVDYADRAGVEVLDARDYGIYASTSFTDSVGVYGAADASSGFVYGVQGFANSPDGAGVRGSAANDGKGVYGSSSGGNGVGVYGATSFGGIGVQGTGYQVDIGVLGESDTTHFPVVGTQTGYATTDSSSRFYWESGGWFGGRNGVIGLTKESGGYAVFGFDQSSSGSSWAGRFLSDNGDGVWISTPVGQTGLTVSGGSKNAVVATQDGARLLYAEESSEVWFADYGFGRLQNGAASIPIDPIFAQTVNLKEPYHVFLQAYGDADLYVTNRTESGFEVRLRDGDPGVEFSYRLVAKRLGYETDRLERAPFADYDLHLFPEKAAELARLQAQGIQP